LLPSIGHIAVLGAGPAGLAVGYYAKKSGIRVTIYEASGRVGGNCATVNCGAFRFDLGAHRFHGKDPEITREVRALLGEDLRRIDLPSAIYHRGRMIAFPPTVAGLAKALGWRNLANALWEVLGQRLRRGTNGASFESFAVQAYGRTIAELFLLNYSQKLWGLSCDRLAPEVTGERLRGLKLKAFLTSALFAGSTDTDHYEGPFYYPKQGFGEIAEHLARACGEENISLNSPVTKLFHDNSRIRGLELAGGRRAEVDRVVSTLPLPMLLRILDPAPPREILQLASGLGYRGLLLVALMLERDSVTRAATVYFPDSEFPFTRIYEPRNRSAAMAPAGKTSVVAEIPCQEGDEWWKKDETELVKITSSHLSRVSLIREEETLASAVFRLRHAYPVLDSRYREKVSTLGGYLDRFHNLKITGRSGTFSYTWTHDMIRFGREIVRAYCAEPTSAYHAGPGTARRDTR